MIAQAPRVACRCLEMDGLHSTTLTIDHHVQVRGDPGKLSIHLRFFNNIFDSVKLPETNNIISNLIRTSTGHHSVPHVELVVFRNGPGTGFDRVTAPIRGIGISAPVTP